VAHQLEPNFATGVAGSSIIEQALTSFFFF
jgi:hypothetical protein